MNKNKKNTQNKNTQSTQEQDTTSQLTQQIETLKQDLTAMTDTAKRALADLQNFKRHADEQRSTLMNMGQIDILSNVMPVYDNLARALNHVPENIQDHEWTKGIENIKNQFLTLLQNCGLELLPGKGQPANPNLHEIVTSIPGTPNNIIIEVLEQGYSFQNKLIKPSKVVVGSDN